MGYRQRNNPYTCIKCDTRADACCCCDPGVDEGYLQVRITGCDRLSSVNLIRIMRKCSPDDLGTGISYPANMPCCVWIGDTGTDTGGCSGYTGRVRLLLWCDPDLGCTQPYRMKVYCEKSDFTWELAGDASIDVFECRCNGPYLEFTLPNPLPCCCDEPPPIATTCCPDNPLPTTLTATDTDSGVSKTLTYNPDTGCWENDALDDTPFGGCSPAVLAFCCSEAGVWFFSVNASATSVNVLVDCDAFEWSGSGPSPCDPFPTYHVTVTL